MRIHNGARLGRHAQLAHQRTPATTGGTARITGIVAVERHVRVAEIERSNAPSPCSRDRRRLCERYCSPVRCDEIQRRRNKSSRQPFMRTTSG